MKFYIPALSSALTCGIFALASVPLHAQPEIEETIVTASPHSKTAAEVAGSLNILSQEQLQREVGSTLGDSLKNQIGVHSSSFGPGVGVPVIRGQSGKRVEVLQNSTTVADVSDTSADHAVASEALLADRIEILRGPATLRYGAGAIGGVINVIDNRIHTQQFEGIAASLETRYNGNSNEKVAVGRIDAGLDQWVLHLDALTRSSGEVKIPGLANLDADDLDETTYGYIENSDSASDAFSLGLSWIGDSILTGLSISQVDNNYGIPSGGHAHEEDHAGHGAGPEPEPEESIFTRIDMEQTQYQGMLVVKDIDGPLSQLNINLNHTNYAHNEIEIEGSESEIGTRFDVSGTEFRGELIHDQLGGWIGAIGLQLSDRDFNAVGEEAFVPASNTNRVGLYLLEETYFGAGVLELGARLDQQSIDTGNLADITHDSFNFSAIYLIPFGDNQRFGAVFSRSERAPVAEELLSDGEHIATNTYEIGSPSLTNESSFNAELTWVLEPDQNARILPGLSARASLFYSNFSNYIYEMDTELRFSHDLEDSGLTGLSSCSGSIVDFENNQEEFDESVECFLYVQEDAIFSGIEAELELPFTDNHGARLWGDYVRAEFSQSGDVPRMPPARIGASWDYSYEFWSTQLSLTHAFDQNRPGEGQTETEGYTRLDAYIGWNAKPFTLFAKATNLTDEDIRNSTSFLRQLAPEAGRAFTLGARYHF